jgi:hypothetical protein
MKTYALSAAAKVLVFAFIMLATSLHLPHVYAQAPILATVPSPERTLEKDHSQVNKASLSFQATAFPMANTNKVKVIFESNTGNGASILIKNQEGKIIHSINCWRINSYMGKFDLSPLPDGEYTVEVCALSKAGVIVQKHIQTFRMKTVAERNLTPIDKQIEKNLYSPRKTLVQRY